MPIWVRPSANQARQREGMENLLRSEPHERQNRPEGAQASAQSQERGEDHAQATLVPEGGVGTGRNGEPGRPEGAIANAATERTSIGEMIRQFNQLDLQREFSAENRPSLPPVIEVSNPTTGEITRYRVPPPVVRASATVAPNATASVRVGRADQLQSWVNNWDMTKTAEAEKPRTFKNPHERFCDLEQQCEGLRYELGRMREELQRVTQFLHQQEFDRNPRTRADAEREWYEHQRAAMMAPDYTQSMTANQAGRF